MRLDAESRLRVRLGAWGLVLGLLVFGVGGACSNQQEEQDSFGSHVAKQRAFYVEQAAELCGGEPGDYEFWRLVGHPYEEHVSIAHIRRPGEPTKAHVVSWYAFDNGMAHETGRLWEHWCDVDVPQGEMDG